MNYNSEPMKYHHKTRIGNWSEEWELEETKRRDYLKKKNENNLQSQSLEKRVSHSIQKASLSFSHDGYLHNNDHIMLYNTKTKGALVCNIWEQILGVPNTFSVYSANSNPSTRSTFIIKRCEEYSKCNIIRFGEKFKLQVNPRLIRGCEYYLQSLYVSPQRCSKLTRRQEVSITKENTFQNVWMFEHPDSKERFESAGQPILANQPVLLKHAMTAQWLASECNEIKNEFGRENEVFAHSFQTHNKTQNLIAEKTGRNTIDINLRSQYEQNTWVILTAMSPDEEFDENILDTPKTAHQIIDHIKNELSKKDGYGLRSLTKIFKNIDENKTNSLDYEDFKWGLRNLNIFLPTEELNVIFNEFDANKNGRIEFNEFLNLLRENIGEKRRELVISAYNKLENKLKGKVSLAELAKLYECKFHPDVLRQAKSESQVFKEFITNWDSEKPEAIISFEEFLSYYTDLSSFIKRDDYFEYLVVKAWGLDK